MPTSQIPNAEKTRQISELIGSGMYLFKQDSYEDALKVFEQALDIEPKSISALQYRGMCRIMLSETREGAKQAMSDFEGVLGVVHDLLMR